MKLLYLLVPIFLSAFISLPPLDAQPAVADKGVVNSASYSPVGLPNSGIAQGSIFTIFGTGMGGDPLYPSGFPLGAALGGTSVEITSGSATAGAILVYTSATQISAILPSSLPAGAASLTVTYLGATSAAAPFQIVANSFGIYTVNAQGDDNGIVTNSQYQIFGSTTAANAGDVVTIWGTGLGAVAGDEAAGPLPGNLSAIPVQVWVGLQAAPVIYQGRSGCCAGLDQIAVTVPSGIAGCSIPVAVQIGAVVSNFVYLPIGVGSRVCADPGLPDVSSLVQQWTQQGALNYGTLTLSHSGSGDSASATFQSFPSADIPYVALTPVFPPVGTCGVYPSFPGGSLSSPSTPLDAGSSITVSGAGGPRQLVVTSPGAYELEGDNPFLTPGPYTFTGPGGTNVGAFAANVTVPQAFTWTNEASVSTVVESQGQSITWSGADPASTIRISGYSLVQSTGASSSFSCRAAAADGQFTIPPFVLLSLPAVTAASNQLVGDLGVDEQAAPVPFTATGLDLGFATADSGISNGLVVFE